jgi:hypothetical protein
MAIGSYGIVRPADVSPDDVDIFYHYVSGRTTTAPVTLKKLTSISVLTPVYHNTDTSSDGGPYKAIENVEILGGMYNLKLSADDFTDLGIYTLHIRPKQIRTTITDCGVLASLPSVRGVVIDLSNVPSGDRNKFTPQGLVGYRIEYINSLTNQNIPNFYKVVTSSFYCTPVTANLSSSTQKSVRYQYSENASNLMFLTITPSSAPSNKPNTIPFIGSPAQKIILTNTYFNPTTIEVEMVEHDSSTLAHALYGNQSKDIANGVYTIYDNNNNNSIYKQYNLFEIKDDLNESLFEIREERPDIDESQDFDTITNV